MVKSEHTFVICAYKESPYLEECILSILRQIVPSRLVLVTSTPNALISSLAGKYLIDLHVNEGETGITQDWNFALSQVRTKYATIAHQDDIYEQNYLKSILEQIRRKPKTLIAFTDYYEIRDGVKVDKNRMARIKRLMLMPLKVKWLSGSRLVRRLILAFGDPICCPSVTYCMEQLEQPIFENRFRSCEDWEAWEKISRKKGDFLYVGQRLIGHRIHEGSTTSEMIEDNSRKRETYIMFRKFWPSWFAKMINYFYTKSERSNKI